GLHFGRHADAGDFAYDSDRASNSLAPDTRTLDPQLRPEGVATVASRRLSWGIRVRELVPRIRSHQPRSGTDAGPGRDPGCRVCFAKDVRSDAELARCRWNCPRGGGYRAVLQQLRDDCSSIQIVSASSLK